MTMVSAPESFSWCSSSRGVYSGLTLTTVQPARRCRIPPPDTAADWASSRQRDPLFQLEGVLQIGRKLLGQRLQLAIARILSILAMAGRSRNL
jgi:hypothetical protein